MGREGRPIGQCWKSGISNAVPGLRGTRGWVSASELQDPGPVTSLSETQLTLLSSGSRKPCLTLQEKFKENLLSAPFIQYQAHRNPPLRRAAPVIVQIWHRWNQAGGLWLTSGRAAAATVVCWSHVPSPVSRTASGEGQGRECPADSRCSAGVCGGAGTTVVRTMRSGLPPVLRAHHGGKAPRPRGLVVLCATRGPGSLIEQAEIEAESKTTQRSQPGARGRALCKEGVARVSLMSETEWVAHSRVGTSLSGTEPRGGERTADRGGGCMQGGFCLDVQTFVF